MPIVSKSFKDFSLKFEKNPVTKDVATLKNESAIKESVKNIVRYNFFEKPFLPQFGANLLAELFELGTATVTQDVERRVTTALEIYEPRIRLTDVTAIFTEEENSLDVKIEYLIIGIPNRIFNVSLTLEK
jgi:phage baseplate assembly protein W